MAIGLFTVFNLQAQKEDIQEIKKIIQQFSDAGDEQDFQTLDALLDDNYRIVMNRLFGSKEVSVMPKQAYLSKIKSKEFGGDKREVKIHEVLVNGNTATAKVTLKGQKATFISFLDLVKTENGAWKLISDTPHIE